MNRNSLDLILTGRPTLAHLTPHRLTRGQQVLAALGSALALLALVAAALLAVHHGPAHRRHHHGHSHAHPSTIETLLDVVR